MFQIKKFFVAKKTPIVLLQTKMVPPKDNTKSEGKQFRLVKFFAYASFFVLIIVSFPLLNGHFPTGQGYSDEEL